MFANNNKNDNSMTMVYGKKLHMCNPPLVVTNTIAMPTLCAHYQLASTFQQGIALSCAVIIMHLYLKVQKYFVYRDGQGLGLLCLYIQIFRFELSLSVNIHF